MESMADFTINNGIETSIDGFDFVYEIIEPNGIMNVNAKLGDELIRVQLIYHKAFGPNEPYSFGHSFKVIDGSFSNPRIVKEFSFYLDEEGNEFKHYNSSVSDDERSWWTENFSDRENTSNYLEFVRTLIKLWKKHSTIFNDV